MRVLFVVHGFPPAAQAGCENYADALARELRKSAGDEVAVFTREADTARPEYAIREYRRDGVRVLAVNNTFRSIRSFDESYRHPRVADLFSAFVEEWRPDVVHIHQLTCLSTLIPERAADAGVPTVMTLHDYWMLCHRGQLFDRVQARCAGPDGGCVNCIDPASRAAHRLRGATPAVRLLDRVLPAFVRQAGRSAAAVVLRPEPCSESLEQRRLAHMRDVWSQLDRFLAPSSALRERFIQAGIPAERIHRCELGFEDPSPAPTCTERLPAALTRAGRLRVGYVGSLMVSKAPHLLLEAASRLGQDVISVSLYGPLLAYHTDASYGARLRPLLESPGVRWHGPVPHREIASAFASMDVLVMTSVWPENSPLVIGEAFMAGVPVIAPRIGGIPELIEDGVNGLLYEPGDVDGLTRHLERVSSTPGFLDALRTAIPGVRRLHDDASETRRLYQHLIEARRTHRFPARVHAIVLNYGTPGTTLVAVRSLLASCPALDTIIVVDNSEDTSCGHLLAELSDRVEYLHLETNRGYAGGMNAGIRHALSRGATHVLLVNSDVTVPPDAVGRALDCLRRRPRAGIAGAVVLKRTAPDRMESAGIRYNWGTGRMRLRAAGAKAATAAAQTGEADAVPGCFMLIDRRVLDRVGLLDERFFFGFEDVDFCLRSRSAGFESVVSPARVYHDGGGTLASGSNARLQYAARNHLRLTARSDRGRWFRTAAVAAFNLAFALKAPPLRIPGRLLAVCRGIGDFALSRGGSLD